MDDAEDILRELVGLTDYNGTGPMVYAYVHGELELVYLGEDMAYLLMEAKDIIDKLDEDRR